MTAALGSGSAPRPLLPQPWARALPLLLGSGPSPFEATRQPSSGRPKAEDLRPKPLTAFFPLTYRYIAREWKDVPLMISYHTHIPVYARTYAPWLGSFGEWISWTVIR